MKPLNIIRSFLISIVFILKLIIPFAILFFILQTFISLWAAGVTVIIFICAYFIWSSIFHIGGFLGPAATGLIKTNLNTYFIARNKTKTHQESLGWMLCTRYPFSDTKRDLVLSLLALYGKHDTELQEVKDLVECIFIFEYGGHPPEKLLMRARKLIDKECSQFL